MSKILRGKTSSDKLTQEVGVRVKRKLKARRNSVPGVWFGLGMIGLVG